LNFQLDSTPYMKELHHIFKSSPLSYSKSSDIDANLRQYFDRAVSIFNSEDFYTSACMFKALIEKCIEHLNHIDDKDGVIGHLIFEVFNYYGGALQQIETDLDKKHFYKDYIDFYVVEDFGFSHELVKILFAVATQQDNYLFERALQEKIVKKMPNYDRDKVLELFILLYDMTSDDAKYFDICKKFPPQSYERYIYAATKYENLGKFDKAVEILEEGIRISTYHKDLLEKKYTELKNRILGLA